MAISTDCHVFMTDRLKLLDCCRPIGEKAAIKRQIKVEQTESSNCFRSSYGCFIHVFILGLEINPFLPFLRCVVVCATVESFGCFYSSSVKRFCDKPGKRNKLRAHAEVVKILVFVSQPSKSSSIFRLPNMGTFEAHARVINRTSVPVPSPTICVEQNFSRAAVITSSSITQWNISRCWRCSADLLETPQYRRQAEGDFCWSFWAK